MADLFGAYKLHPVGYLLVAALWITIVWLFVREVGRSFGFGRIRKGKEPSPAAMEDFKAKVAAFDQQTKRKRSRTWYWEWWSPSGNLKESDWSDSPPPGFWERMWAYIAHGKRCVVIDDLE